MKCVNCPYIQEELKDRIRMELKYNGFISGFKSVEYNLIEYCYCDKVGHELSAGKCSDAEYMDENEWFGFLYCNGFDLNLVESFDDNSQPNDTLNDTLKETKKQKKRRRDRKSFNKKKRIYDDLKYWYPTPFWPKYKNDDEKEEILYFRTFHHNRYKQFLKKQSNKKIRRAKGLTRKSCLWKKVFDLWWVLW